MFTQQTQPIQPLQQQQPFSQPWQQSPVNPSPAGSVLPGTESFVNRSGITQPIGSGVPTSPYGPFSAIGQQFTSQHQPFQPLPQPQPIQSLSMHQPQPWQMQQQQPQPWQQQQWQQHPSSQHQFQRSVLPGTQQYVTEQPLLQSSQQQPYSQLQQQPLHFQQPQYQQQQPQFQPQQTQPWGSR